MAHLTPPYYTPSEPTPGDKRDDAKSILAGVQYICYQQTVGLKSIYLICSTYATSSVHTNDLTILGNKILVRSLLKSDI